MQNQLCQSERGSIAPVWIMLLATVILLAVAVIEREWVNYQLKLAEQTADLAAEAGGQTHEAFASLTVGRFQYWYVARKYCAGFDEDGNCIEDTRYEYRSAQDTKTVQGRESDVRDNWRALANCGSDSERPNWRCTCVTVDRRWVEFDEDAERAALETFWGNWTDHGAASIRDVSVIPRGTQNTTESGPMVLVQTELMLRPLFGLGVWSEEANVFAAAAIKLAPLSFGNLDPC